MGKEEEEDMTKYIHFNVLFPLSDVPPSKAMSYDSIILPGIPTCDLHSGSY